VSSRRNRVVARFVLGPCQRPGVAASDTDWWHEQHASCPGWDVLKPGVAVRCTCLCHTSPDSDEALARAAATQLASARVDMDVARLEQEVHDA
jgi:hypothetical protein